MIHAFDTARICPTIAVLFDSNRTAVYTLAIYDRLYTTELTSEITIAKMQMAAIFFSRFKVWLMNDAVWQHKCL